MSFAAWCDNCQDRMERTGSTVEGNRVFVSSKCPTCGATATLSDERTPTADGEEPQ